jgi:hypothetical protein
VDFSFVPTARRSERLASHIEDGHFDPFAGKKKCRRAAHDSSAKDGNSGGISHVH